MTSPSQRPLPTQDNTTQRRGQIPMHYWLTDWLIMSMRWDYASDLRPTTGLLFIPQVMSMETHCGITSTHSWFVHQSYLTILPAESCSSKHEERTKETWNWSCEVFLFILHMRIFICHKNLMIWGFWLDFPSDRRLAADFYNFQIHCLGRAWTRKPWAQWRAR
jgi:hypothetical protein